MSRISTVDPWHAHRTEIERGIFGHPPTSRQRFGPSIDPTNVTSAVFTAAARPSPKEVFVKVRDV
jgi:hypothetical protein